MLDIRHFDHGTQPQERAELHAQLLASPEWADKDHNELAVELGETIIATLGSLTTRMWRGQNTLGDATIDLSSQASPDNSNIFPTNPAVLETGGLDMGHLRRWRERLEDSKEDRPIRFDLVGQNHGLGGEPRHIASVWFDGVHYGIGRHGRTFEYPVPDGAPIPASAIDSWSVWDYHATKRQQHTAKREHMRVDVEQQIFELNDSLYSEQLAKILCRIGLLHSDRFTLMEKSRIIEETGQGWDSISYREILDRKALGASEFSPGERLRYFDLLDAHTAEMVDETQRALVRFWFVTQGEREAYRDPQEPAESVRQRLNELLAAEVQRTNGAGIWDTVRMQQHLLSVFDDEAAAFTDRFAEHFTGHAFQSPKATTDIYAPVEYPELNGDSRFAPLTTAVALAVNEPPLPLIEDLRQLRRLQEDIQTASDDEHVELLTAEQRALADKVESTHEGYFAQLEATAEEAEIGVRRQLGLPARIDERALLIEGILLARHIAGLADAS